jgi:hypothetical protein
LKARKELSLDPQEITNEDIARTKKVLKHLKPILKQKNIHVGVIVKELNKLKRQNDQYKSEESENDAEHKNESSTNTSHQMECSYFACEVESEINK